MIEISKREEFLAMASGVKDCVKFTEKQIKEEKEYLIREEKDKEQLGYFEDCGEFYHEQVLKRKVRIETMIEMKIKLEKYSSS